MDLQGRLLQMLQAQEGDPRNESSSSNSSPSRRDSSGSSSPRRGRRERKRRTRRRSRSPGRRYRERKSSRDYRRDRDRRDRRPRRSRSRGRRFYRERGGRRDRPHLGSDFKHRRAPDGRPFCIDFQLGRCRRDNCRYYHQLKEKCLDFGRGRCSYGDKCKFRHADSRENEKSLKRKRSASEERSNRRKERGRDITDKYQIKDDSSDPGSPKAKDKDSDPMPSLIQTTQIDVTKSEPTEYVDDLQLTKDENNEDENNKDTSKTKEENEAEMGESEDSNVNENPGSDVIEEEIDQPEKISEENDEADIQDQPSECPEPVQPVSMKEDPILEDADAEIDVDARG